MNAHVSRRVVEPQRYLQNGFPWLVVHRQGAALRQVADGLQNLAHRAVRQPLRKMVHFAWGHAKHFCDFAHGQPRVHSHKTADHRDVLFAPSLVDVVEQFIAPRAANVDVDIGAIAALLV